MRAKGFRRLDSLRCRFFLFEHFQILRSKLVGIQRDSCKTIFVSSYVQSMLMTIKFNYMSNFLSRKIEVCTICREFLPLEPRPIFQFAKNSKILIIGQAPGKKTHEAGVPWDDKSGERLREWLGVSHEQFYNPAEFTLVPMGFCYPGKGKSGDLPPRPECAEKWMQPVRRFLKNIVLEIFIGKYSCDYHFEKFENLTSLIKNQTYAQDNRLVLPHPSPRNNIWLKKNPWFAKTTLLELKAKVKEALQ